MIGDYLQKSPDLERKLKVVYVLLTLHEKCRQNVLMMILILLVVSEVLSG